MPEADREAAYAGLDRLALIVTVMNAPTDRTKKKIAAEP